MSDVSKLKELLAKQSELAGEIAAQTSELTGDKLLQDAERLRGENEALNKNYSGAKDRIKALETENANLKDALRSQLQADRARFLINSEKKMNA